MMSKAFTREDDSNQEEPADLRPQGPELPPGAKNYMTPAGASKLREELDHMLLGSSSPKTEDKARTRYLQQRLDELAVVDPLHQNSQDVRFGATVTVRDEDEVERIYRIVGVDEADPPSGRVSWISPLATALIGFSAGEVITLHRPSGDEDLEIVRVAYEEIQAK